MNCFSMRNHFTDLMRSNPDVAAEEHLRTCTTCTKKLTHLKELRSLIKRLPTHSILPQLKTLEDRASSDQEMDDHLEEQRKNRFFDQSPWYVKSGIEAVTLALMTVGIIWGIPKVRQLYDHSIQRRLETIDLNDVGNSGLSDNDPTLTVTQAMAPEVKATENEVWRINIKTDALSEIQKRLLASIKSEHSVDDRESIAGVVAPGGVQIEFTASTEFIQQFKNEINAISKQIEQENAQPVANANPKIKARTSGLTWYKSKSKVKLAKGKIKIVIWLSQM